MSNETLASHEVLIYSDKKDQSQLIKKIVKGILEFPHFKVCYEIDKAKDSLAMKFDLLILSDEEYWIKERKLLEANGSPKILLFKDEKAVKYFSHIPNLFLVPINRLLFNLVEVLKNIFEINDPVRIQSADKLFTKKHFLPVPCNKVQQLKSIPCDIYFSVNGKKYVKVANANEDLSSSTISLYLSKEIEGFYVISEDYYANELALFGAKEIEEKLSSDFDKSERAVEVLRSAVVELGFSEVLLTQVDGVVDDIYHVFDGEKYQSFLNNLDTSKGHYLFNHSYLTSLLASSFVKNQAWSSAEVQKKVITGSMLHSLAYKKKENSFYENCSAEKFSQLPRSVQEDIDGHEKRVVELLKNDKNISDDILKIIKTINLSPEDASSLNATQFNRLCAVVNLSHYVASKLYRIAFNEKKIPSLLKEVSEFYNRGPFKSLLEAFITNVESTLLTNK